MSIEIKFLGGLHTLASHFTPIFSLVDQLLVASDINIYFCHLNLFSCGHNLWRNIQDIEYVPLLD